MKIALIGTDWNSNETRKNTNDYGGVTYYRLIKPLMELGSDKYEFTYHGADLSKEAESKSVIDFWSDFVDRYDLFIVKHIDNEEACSNLLFFVRRAGKKIILDLDDNLFEVKKDQPAYEYYAQGKPKRAVVSALISLVDGLFVSTQPLADYYTKHVKDIFNIDLKVFVLPNYNDKNDFSFTKTEKDSDKIVIGWAGSTTHFEDLKIAIPAIEKLLKEYPNLYFDLIGGLTHEDAPRLFENVSEKVLDRVFVGSGTESWTGYPEMLSKLKWDIGIAPLTDDEFNRGKSHIKWMEYACYQIPCVASKVYPYYMPILGQNTIEDNVTGMLCEKKDWYKALKTLIENKEMREQIGKNAQQYVFENLQYKDHRYLWINALSSFCE
ncbi:MAG: glycosyltransferase [Minisyncoccia bacterium]